MSAMVQVSSVSVDRTGTSSPTSRPARLRLSSATTASPATAWWSSGRLAVGDDARRLWPMVASQRPVVIGNRYRDEPEHPGLPLFGLSCCFRGRSCNLPAGQRLVENLHRGLADNSVGKIIEALLRNELIICDEVGFAPLDSTGSQLLFRFVAAAYERRSLAIASHWAFQEWAGSCPSTAPPSTCSTGCCATTMSSPPTARATGCAKPAPDQEAAPRRANHTRGGDFRWPPAETASWPLTTGSGDGGDGGADRAPRLNEGSPRKDCKRSAPELGACAGNRPQ